MRALPIIPRMLLSLALGAVALSACNCDEVLEETFPRMLIDPEEVTLEGIAVAQDTRVIFQVTNSGRENLTPLQVFWLEQEGGEDLLDPMFTLVEPTPPEVLNGTTEEVTVVIRPPVDIPAGEFAEAHLVFVGPENTKPRSRVEVPIRVNADDLGLPEICSSVGAQLDPFPAIEFDPIGMNSVARAPTQICNCGIRDLIIDDISIEPETDGDDTIKNTTQVSGVVVGPNECITLDIVFAPEDLDEHNAEIVVRSNDPDEPEVRIPAAGRAEACPIACIELVDGPDGIEPFDTVRFDATCSTPAAPDVPIEAGEWDLAIRPGGSTAIIDTDDGLAAEIGVDIAGEYCVRTHVVDANGIRSCEAAEICFDVIPTEDLHVQLVWDHADADLDLHMVRQPGGDVFNHDTDVYFSNRTPDPVAPWSTDPEQNPSLDRDDSEGYGPENTNIVHPAPGSQWSVFVHYWNKQTDGDARTTATLRVFVYGQQVIELTRIFEDEEQMWHAIDIEWPPIEGDPAAISQVGVVEPFPRPF